MIRLVIVDDHPLVRDGLRLRLANQPELEIVGEASNALEALALIARVAPDLVLSDVGMPGMSDRAVARQAQVAVRNADPEHRDAEAVVARGARDDVADGQWIRIAPWCNTSSRPHDGQTKGASRFALSRASTFSWPGTRRAVSMRAAAQGFLSPSRTDSTTPFWKRRIAMKRPWPRS